MVQKINFYPSGMREILFLVAGSFSFVISWWLQSIEFCGYEDWLQRSGSLLVILGVLSESKHIEKVISANKGITGEPLTFIQKFVNHSGFFMALLGTVIWGYGDIIFEV